MPNRKGLVTGIIVAGFGAGAFFFGFIALQVVNPARISVEITGVNANYYDPNSAVPENVPKLFFVLGTCYFVLITIGSSLLSNPPENAAPSDDVDSAVENRYFSIEDNSTSLKSSRRASLSAEGFSGEQEDSRAVVATGQQQEEEPSLFSFQAIRTALFGPPTYQPPMEPLHDDGRPTTSDALFLNSNKPDQQLSHTHAHTGGTNTTTTSSSATASNPLIDHSHNHTHTRTHHEDGLVHDTDSASSGAVEVAVIREVTTQELIRTPLGKTENSPP
jgi:hypothetical protein